MMHLAATVALGPLLLLQGRHVRRVTPVLPEPPGPREGTAGQGPPLRLLILGDSAAAGVGAANQDEALSGRLVAALAHHHAVHWQLLAHTGHTTRDALAVLSALPPQPFDVVVTSLGVNDVTGGHSVRRWVADQRALLARLRQDCGAPLCLLSALPPMHRFPALPQPLRGYLGAQARRFDAALQGLAAQTPGCRWVGLVEGAHAAVLGPQDMAADGFHPGPAIYAAWAARLAAHIPLVPSGG
jgi:lysophospholipase L1-like esterase